MIKCAAQTFTYSIAAAAVATALYLGFNASQRSVRYRAAEDAKIVALTTVLHDEACVRLGKPLSAPDHAACVDELKALKSQYEVWSRFGEWD